MKKITKIDAIKHKSNNKLKVAAYARVSTSSEEQLLSLENQKEHYKKRIKSNPNWKFTQLYYDEGISGTKINKRSGLKQLLKDCENGKVDFIITKSISRFSRNVIDCLKIVRRLIELNIFIEFEKENINTQMMDDELVLSILSSLAENESKSISKNVKWTMEKKFKNGTYKIGYTPYGYDWINNEMIINNEQAKVVKQIFKDVLSGKSAQDIADTLNEQGIKTKKNKNWSDMSIRFIIKNEKYTGDALLARTYTDDSFKRKKNNGEQNMYYIENHHEAIISKSDFEKANQIIVVNAKSKNIKKRDAKYQNRYVFSGLIKCHECNGTFKRRIQYRNKNDKYVAWTCANHLNDKHSCSMKFIKEEQIHQAFLTMMNKLIFSNQVILKPLLENIKLKTYFLDELNTENIDSEIARLKDNSDKLVQFVSNGYIEQSLFIKEQQQLKIKINHLEDKKKSLENIISLDISTIQNLENLVSFTKKNQMLTSFDEELFETYVESIDVVSREEIIFNLKFGLKLKERML